MWLPASPPIKVSSSCLLLAPDLRHIQSDEKRGHGLTEIAIFRMSIRRSGRGLAIRALRLRVPDGESRISCREAHHRHPAVVAGLHLAGGVSACRDGDGLGARLL